MSVEVPFGVLSSGVPSDKDKDNQTTLKLNQDQTIIT